MEWLELWDFTDPKASERRFRQALKSADDTEALVLQTQLARTFGLRREFAEARRLLAEVEPDMTKAPPLAQAHYQLELGRCNASTTHPADSLSETDLEAARSAYQHAYELAVQAEADYVAIDALHMLAFVETSTEQQIHWNKKAINHMQASDQPEARKWEASLRNNLGMALHNSGDNEIALDQFKLALAATEGDGSPEMIRIARWMIGWTLRLLGRNDEALALQLELEEAWDEAGEPDPYVYQELKLLYQALGESDIAERYAAKEAASPGG